MNADDEKVVNIYLNREERFKNSTNNECQAYIINSHDKMLQEYNSMKRELEYANNKIYELEGENDRLEKSLINLRGFVKNLSEMNKVNRNLYKKYAEFQNETRTLLMNQYAIVHQFTYDMYLDTAFVLAICAILYWFKFISMIDLIFTLTFKFGMFTVKICNYQKYMPYIKNIFKKINLNDTPYYDVSKKMLPKIQVIQDELKNIEAGNNFLNDLIDLQ